MKDEIKEILDYLKNDSWETEYDKPQHTFKILEEDNCKQLLDYITNLQEERKTLYKYTPEKGFRLVDDEDD